MKKALTIIGVVGGLSAQFASLAGALNPKAGAIVGGVAVVSAAVGHSLVEILAATKPQSGAQGQSK